MNKRNRGITLVALVITIIVLLIMAGVSIALVVGDNGVLSKAKEAKTGSLVAEEKEKLNLAYSSALTKNLGNTVTAENLQTELDESVGSGKTTVTVNGNNITVLFNETGNTYNLNNGRITESNGGTASSGLSDAQILKEFYLANNYTADDVEKNPFEPPYEVENEKVWFLFWLIEDEVLDIQVNYVLYKGSIFKVKYDNQLEDFWEVTDVEYIETIDGLDLTSSTPGIRIYSISVGEIGSILVTPSTPDDPIHPIYEDVATILNAYYFKNNGDLDLTRPVIVYVDTYYEGMEKMYDTSGRLVSEEQFERTNGLQTFKDVYYKDGSGPFTEGYCSWSGLRYYDVNGVRVNVDGASE